MGVDLSTHRSRIGHFLGHGIYSRPRNRKRGFHSTMQEGLCNTLLPVINYCYTAMDYPAWTRNHIRNDTWDCHKSFRYVNNTCECIPPKSYTD